MKKTGLHEFHEGSPIGDAALEMVRKGYRLSRIVAEELRSASPNCSIERERNLEKQVER